MDSPSPPVGRPHRGGVRFRGKALGRWSLGGLVATLLVALGGQVVAPSVACADDFDPRGRRPRSPAPARPSPAKPTVRRLPTGVPRPAPSPPSSPPPPPAASASDALLERYMRVVLSEPGSPFPLQRLAQLHRERHGSLAPLLKELEARAAARGPDRYAALLAIAGLSKLDGRIDDAVKAYAAAIAEKKDDPRGMVALAQLHKDRGDHREARARFEAALPLQSAPPDREATLRALVSLCLELKQWDDARRFHLERVKAAPTSLYLRGELGRELLQRGEFERAESELKELVAASAGDHRTLAPALRDLGRAQAKAGKRQEALATLRRALGVAGQEAAVRQELYETLTDVYRGEQRLGELVQELEKERPSDFARVALLASLYEETGDIPKAIATFRRAIALDPRQLDLRVRLVRLLQSQGEITQAIAEYDGLIRAAPRNPTFVFEQCDALLQQGERARVLALLTALEGRVGTDEEVLSRVADFYGRIGEQARAVRILERLAAAGTNDPSYLVDLGDRHFQDGRPQLALTTWRRLLTTIAPRARALAAYGEVLLEHDLTADALVALREAVDLDGQNLAYRKQLAAALERARNYREASALWQDIGERARSQGDRTAMREARTRKVTLWSLDKQLDSQIAPLKSLFARTPPDVEAGRTLAEVQLHLRKLDEAEATLVRLVEVAPGDVDARLQLERVLVQSNKLAKAIEVLEKLVELEPRMARELYQRMAQYALASYKDADAVTYAARAVELNPDDAEGHKRLGDLYRSRQDADRAIAAYRQAIARNERLFPVYFALADLLLSRGEEDEADRLYRRVVRSAPDEELVGRAARLSMQVHMAKGTLDVVERELLPLAIGQPQRTIYRRLLVEVYANLTFQLVQRAKAGATLDAQQARAELARVGGRAVKPMLDVLAGGDTAEQRVAIDVLAFTQNRGASGPLFAFATGQSDAQLRQRAMVACGALRDPGLLPRYTSLLQPVTGDRGTFADGVTAAAAWAVARLGDRRAVPLLKAMAKSASPDVRAYAALGLAHVRDKSAVRDLGAMLQASEAGPWGRAAAAFALGELDGYEQRQALLQASRSSEGLVRQIAMQSLARIAARRPDGALRHDVTDLLAAGVFEPTTAADAKAEAARNATVLSAMAGLVELSGTLAGARLAQTSFLPVPDGNLAVEAVLRTLYPTDFTPSERARALVAHAEVLAKAGRTSLAAGGARARSVLQVLGGGRGTFPPFVTQPSHATAEQAASIERLIDGLARAAVPLVSDANFETRALVIGALARSNDDGAVDALVKTLASEDDAAQRVALSAIAAERYDSRPNERLVAAVALVLRKGELWSTRAVATEALRALGRGLGGKARGTALLAALEVAAREDSYGLVREAALRALAQTDLVRAREVAKAMAATEPLDQLRVLCARLAAGQPLDD